MTEIPPMPEPYEPSISERLRRRLELRRSNAAAPHRNRKKYTRKDKSWKREA